MIELVIEKKNYILILQKNYNALRKKASLKSKPEKTLTIEQSRSYSKKMIRKWAGKNSYEPNSSIEIILLKCIIIYFYPVTIGVLHINLFNAIGPVLAKALRTLPVAILHLQLIKMFHKIC
jgi:hypothetical protein